MIRLILFSLFFLLIPTLVSAAEIELFQETIPFIGDAANLTLEDYIRAIYQGAIGIAALLVVIRLIWAGTEYMLSDVITTKQSALEKIRGAILGILLILAVVTILNSINPNLTQLNFLRSANPTQPLNSGTNSPVISQTVNKYEIYPYPKNDDETISQMSACEALAREDMYTSSGIKLVYNRDEAKRTADCREVVQHYELLWSVDISILYSDSVVVPIHKLTELQDKCKDEGGILVGDNGGITDSDNLNCRKAIQ